MNTNGYTVALLPNSKQIATLILDYRLVVTMVEGNAAFPNPTPPLAQLSAHLDALAACEELARKGGKGMAQQRDSALRVVRSDMRLLQAYVQSIADSSAADAEAIITSAGMRTVKKVGRSKPPLYAKRGKASGRVIVEAKALPSPVQYCWQMSEDQNTWTDLAPTFHSSTSVEGLTPVKVYSFRFRANTKHGLSEWSSPVSVIAH